MAERNFAYRVVIGARDEASAIFGSLRSKVAGVAAAIAGYFSIRLFGDAVSSAAEFEAALSRVQAASNASAAEMQQLREAADAAGTNTKFTATEAAEALENLSKAGLSARDSVNALPAVLQLAQAGGVELGQSAEFITRAVNGMGLSFADAGRVADVLAAGANASNTSVEGLAGALSFAAPIANSLGLTLEETAAIIGKFADAGIDASRAGTALNSILSQFSDPASKFRQALGDAGITTNDFNAALRQLAAAGPQGQAAILAVGQEAGPALRALLNQGMGALDELTAKLQGAAGSAAATAATMGDNLQGALTGLSSAWDALRRTVVEPLLEPLKGQVDALSERLRALVTEGTAGKVGEALREAFQTATKYLGEFLDRFDGQAIVESIRRFSTQAAEIFRDLGARIKTVGDTADLVFGVMRAGFDTVLGVIYKIAEAFSGVASNITSGAATIAEGLSKITFGDLSAGFRRVAAEIRETSGALWAVSEEFAERSKQSFDDALAGAEQAREGWNGLTGSVKDASAEVEGFQEDIKATQSVLKSATEDVETFGESVKKSMETQKQSAEETKKSVDELWEKYNELFNLGDFKGAEELFGLIQRLAAEAAKAASDGAQEIEAAFKRMGIVSTEELKRQADNAKRDYELIRDSGVSSAEDIANAFEVYAEKAIKANGGVASEALKVEAALRGVSLAGMEVGAGVRRGAEVAIGELERIADRAGEVETALGRVGVIKWNQRDKPDLSENGGPSGPGKMGFSAGTSLGNRLGIANFMASAGIDFNRAFELAKQFVGPDGTVPYFNPPGVRRGETISAAVMRVVQKEIERQNGGAISSSLSGGNAVFGSTASGGTPAPAPAAPATPAPQRTVRIEVNLGFRRESIEVAAGDERKVVEIFNAINQDLRRVS